MDDGGVRFGPADDELHPPDPHADWTETSWWSFNVPERSLAGWLYAQVRPNVATTAGGAFVYDSTSHLPWKLPYYAFFQHHPMPDPTDLRHVTFRNGVSIRCIEPAMRYALAYRFRDETEFVADLEFEGLIPPVPHLTGAPPFTGSSHYDQPGRVTGTLELRGDRIDVDCISVRDRSWGRRPELFGRRGRLSYTFGSATPNDAFLAFCAPPGDAPLSDEEHLSSGYLFRDGAVRRLAEAQRRVTRDPEHGGVDRVEIRGRDTDGRQLHAVGDAVSRMFLSGHALTINTLLRWSIDDTDGRATGWGEDQDVWPLLRFSDRWR